MKKVSLIATFILSAIVATAQPVPMERSSRNPSYSSTAEHYLAKSRSQRTAAWCMLGGGFVLGTAGYYIILEATFGDSWDDYASKYSTGSLMMYVGTGCMLGSIPLFIAAARNKGRGLGASAGIKMEPITTPVQHGFAKKSYPALTLKFTLK